jgi:1L-myo-inositol 1-phosphate cytidylyltransferase
MLTCVILAAGRGSRLNPDAGSKPLSRVNGRALIDWVVLAARHAGVDHFVVVTGFARDDLERHLHDLAARLQVRIDCTFNPDWKRGNGTSASHARPFVGNRFLLLMADHIVDPTILADLACQPLVSGELVLAVDARVSHHPTVDLGDVTRVQVDEGRIASIGKGLDVYNAFDTGNFLCTPALFDALAESQAAGNASLTGGVRVMAARRAARVMDVDGRSWVDVDDEASRLLAERMLAASPVLDVEDETDALPAIEMVR